VKGANRAGLRGRHLSEALVLAGGNLCLFERDLQLVDEAVAALER
jgi:hypothetical protein